VTVRVSSYDLGDIFESEADLSDETLWMNNSWNVEQQRKSREAILQKADWIIPGHGAMFRNQKKT